MDKAYGQALQTEELAGWNEFIDALALGALVPPAYEAYRPAIIDGLIFFLEHLDEDRALAILGEQALLPEDAGINERIVAIARNCPALHKLGQVLARDRRLSPDLRCLLQGLESMPSQLGAAEARALAEAELGPLADLGIRIEEPPLAEASVAVVVPFEGRDAGGQPLRGVLKLLKPGVEAALAAELETLQRIGALLDERCEAYRLPAIAYEETFRDVRALLAREVRLDQEQAHMRRRTRRLGGNGGRGHSRVYGFSTPRVTAMQRIDGCKVTDAAAKLPRRARRRLGDAVIRALIARPLWAAGGEDLSLFHADPHAGNLFATADGKLAILDWSLVGALSKADRVALTQLVIGALTIDRSRIRAAIDALSQGRSDGAALAAVIDERIGTLKEGAFPGMGWVTSLLDEAALHARCRFDGDLLMFRKVLQTLEGVVADVSADARPDRVLVVSVIKALAAEWGQRLYAPPFSRHFATHLSTLDLTQLWASAPLIGQRQLYGLTRNNRPRSPVFAVAG
ncbi:MAG: AarF/UbiB family protein [Rhodospirillales bacterium]